MQTLMTQTPTNTQALKQTLVHSQVEATISKKTVLCLVMPAAERSLEHVISAERIAGVDLTAIKAFGVDIAGALKYLHGEKLVHGDFKPRNIVRIHGDWKLIDFDASVRVILHKLHTYDGLGTRALLIGTFLYHNFTVTIAGGRGTCEQVQQRVHPA